MARIEVLHLSVRVLCWDNLFLGGGHPGFLKRKTAGPTYPIFCGVKATSFEHTLALKLRVVQVGLRRFSMVLGGAAKS